MCELAPSSFPYDSYIYKLEGNMEYELRVHGKENKIMQSIPGSKDVGRDSALHGSELMGREAEGSRETQATKLT